MSYDLIGTPTLPVCYETRTCDQRPYLCSTGDLGGTSRAFYNIVDSCTQIRLLFTNFYNGSAGETFLPSAPGPITINANVEDPYNVGTPLYAVTFTSRGGGSTLTIPLNGFAFSDPIDFGESLVGKTLWVRTNVVGVSGQYFPNNAILQTQNQYPAGYGYITTDTSQVGNNYKTDSASGTGADNTATPGTAWITKGTTFVKCYTPTAVIGQRVAAALPASVIAILGDSIAEGFGDLGAGEFGWIVRGLRTAGVRYFNLASPSELMTTAATEANYRVRRTLTQYATHAVVEYGVNDIFTALVTFATLQSNAQIVYRWLVNRGIKVYATTVTPNTSSTDSWTTAGNQAPHTGNTVRVQWNDYLRTWSPATADPVLALLSGVIDACSSIEVNASNAFTIDGGRWYCGPGNTTAYTADGLHPNALGHALMQPTLRILA